MGPNTEYLEVSFPFPCKLAIIILLLLIIINVTIIIIIIIIIIIELTHNQTILEITDEMEQEPAVLDFKNLLQYSSCPK